MKYNVDVIIMWLVAESTTLSGRIRDYVTQSGGVVVTTSASDAGGTGSIPGTDSCDINIWLSTLGTVYPS